MSMIRKIFYSIFLSIKQTYPKINFIFAGDLVNQLLPFNDRADFDFVNNPALYYLCNGNELNLSMCRRSDGKVYKLAMDVMNLKTSDFPHVEQKVSICYTNRKRIEVNDMWMDRTLRKNKKKHMKIPKLKDDPNSQDMKVFVGLPIIAKVNFKKYDIVNAEKFDVIKIDFEKV